MWVFILEKELSEILNEIYWKGEGEIVPLPEIHKLYFSAKQKYLSLDEEARTQVSSRLMLKILFVVGRISEEFIKKWQDGQIKPNDRELTSLKEGCDEVLAAFEVHFRKELTSYYAEQGKQFSTQHEKVKEKIKKIRILIQDQLNRNKI